MGLSVKPSKNLDKNRSVCIAGITILVGRRTGGLGYPRILQFGLKLYSEREAGGPISVT
jgi:hypothetical protein